MKKSLVIFLGAIFFCGYVFAQSEQKIRFSGVPALGFGADSGFGGGLVGRIYADQDNFVPYRWVLGLKGYITTKNIHAHEIGVDFLQVLGLPLRIISRAGFSLTPNQNFCGLGALANCNEEIKKHNSNNYYLYRYKSFFGDLHTRWLIFKQNSKLEFMTNYRGRYYLDGDFKTREKYPDSLYKKIFADQKTQGYLGILEIGFMLDSRDNEPAPTSGYWIEASTRGGAWFLGSAWDFYGANISARFYASLDHDKKLVFASQSILDLIIGDLPYDAMARVGGSAAIKDHGAFGGQFMGRGIRDQYFVGRFKFIQQLELRYNFVSFDLWRQNFEIGTAGFVDGAMISWGYQNFISEIAKIKLGFGGGLRFFWNKTFIVRADLGVSPAEKFVPRIYLVVDNVF